MDPDPLLGDSEEVPRDELQQPVARRQLNSRTVSANDVSSQNRARSPLRLPAALVSPRALFAALPSALGEGSGTTSPSGASGAGNALPSDLLFRAEPPAPIARPTSPGIAHPGQHSRRRGGHKHASSLQTLRNNALPSGNQRLLFFPGAVPSTSAAARNKARQTTHYGAGDADYSPSPSPPLSPGFGALGTSNGGGFFGRSARAAGKQRAINGDGNGTRINGIDPMDSLTNPLLSDGPRGRLHGNTNGGVRRISWTRTLFRPTKDQVEGWLDSWLKRWTILAIIPALVVWIWCAVPFPHSDPDSVGTPWCDPKRHPDEVLPPWCKEHQNETTIAPEQSGKFAFHWADVLVPDDALHAHVLATSGESTSHFDQRQDFENMGHKSSSTVLSVGRHTHALSNDSEPESPPAPPPTPPGPLSTDANFLFFLLFYYGIYVAVALIYITQLFSLYRLNWWPAALGARTSYAFFWVSTLVVGWAIHRWDPFGAEDRHRKNHGAGDDIQWQRKTLWVLLAFVAMAMPAVVCLTGLRRSGRQTYRHSLTDMQKTFLERQLTMRIPSSYIRFLWFISSILLALSALLAGQGYASVYLSTLPHTSLEGTAYVTFWMTTVNCMALASHWILEEKVRSRALVFVFKYYYFLVYFIFYRNLFARLRSFDQFALIQLLSSFWVCIWYPFSMSGFCHRIVQYFNPEPKSWEEYVESVGLAFYLRNLAQNTTMLAFLGWVSILHFGNNQQLYPFFAFADKNDPYNYQLTMLGSLAIWASELLSSFVARELCKWAFHVDVTALGLDEMRAYPEIVPTCVWSTIHVLMDMLFFLIKLNFH
ncbi:hypothetical protein OC846_001014 [Tilletia horrida]|uniref:Uncharacterized protein n=1 Tax=Tilletia horrida TaxID=155126 RepID=A0AAN6GUU3_9BASI|nr:hypothetical protein OC846_001014 [Tilletia horrida]KAK0567363.1 hypothetical protein OC861_002773 [Tilletia horrida]